MRLIKSKSIILIIILIWPLYNTVTLSEEIVGVTKVFSQADTSRIQFSLPLLTEEGEILLISGIDSKFAPFNYFTSFEAVGKYPMLSPIQKFDREKIFKVSLNGNVVATKANNPTNVINISKVQSSSIVDRIIITFTMPPGQDFYPADPLLVPKTNYVVIAQDFTTKTSVSPTSFSFSLTSTPSKQLSLSSSSPVPFAGPLFLLDHSYLRDPLASLPDASEFRSLLICEGICSWHSSHSPRFLSSSLVLASSSEYSLYTSVTPSTTPYLAELPFNSLVLAVDSTSDGKVLLLATQDGELWAVQRWQGEEGEGEWYVAEGKGGERVRAVEMTHYALWTAGAEKDVLFQQNVLIVDARDLKLAKTISFQNNLGVAATEVALDYQGGVLVPVFAVGDNPSSDVYRFSFVSTKYSNFGDLDPKALNICGVEKDTCGLCDSSCKSCNYMNVSECLSCNEPQVLLNGVCTDCTIGFYYANEACNECSTNCESCSITKDSCLTCNIGMLLYLNHCIDTCPEGTFRLNEKCIDCHETCLTCEGEQPYQCLSCDSNKLESLLELKHCKDSCSPGYTPYKGTCLSCGEGCDDCTINIDGIYCIICKDPLKLVQGKCMINCPSDNFFSTSTNSCQKCLESCDTCSNSIECESCNHQSGIKYLYNKRCLLECPPNTYISQDKPLECLDCSGFIFEHECLSNCPSGTIQVEDRCQKNSNDTLLSPKESNQDVALISKRYLLKERQVILTFSKNMASVNPKALNFTFSDSSGKIINLAPSKVTLKGESIYLAFYFNQTLDSANLTIDKLIPDVEDPIKTYNSSNARFVDYPIKVVDISYYVGKLDSKIGSSARVVGRSINLGLLILLISNLPAFLTFLKFFQVIRYICFFNIAIPNNIRQFFDIFIIDFTELLPNYIQLGEDKRVNWCGLYDRIEANELYCLFTDNMGSQILQFGALLFLYFLTKIWKCIRKGTIRNSTSKSSRIAKKIENILSEITLIQFLVSNQIKMIFSSIIAMTSKDSKSDNLQNLVTVSTILAIVSSLLMIFLCGFFLFIVIEYLAVEKIIVHNENSQENNQTRFVRYLEVFGKVKIKSRWSSTPFLLLFFRDLLFPIWIYMFMEIPTLQIILPAFYLGSKGIFIGITRPYINLRETLIESISDILVFIAMILFSLIDIMQQKNVSQEAMSIYVGIPIIMLLSIGIGLNCTSSIGFQFYRLIVWLRSRRGSNLVEPVIMELPVNLSSTTSEVANPLQITNSQTQRRRRVNRPGPILSRRIAQREPRSTRNGGSKRR